MVSSEDDVNSGALDEQTHSTERDEAVETSAAAVSVDSPETDSPESEEGEDADSGEDGADGEDESGIKLTRRGALAAITAAIGGVSAGILNTNETPEIEAFGYGGAPVSSNESATANATNGTTSAGSLPTTGINQTESTNETGPAGAEADPTGNETETGDAGNTTVSTNNTNTTAANEELAPETEPEPEDGETEPSPTNGEAGPLETAAPMTAGARIAGPKRKERRTAATARLRSRPTGSSVVSATGRVDTVGWHR